MTAPLNLQSDGGKLCPGACKVYVERAIVKTSELAHWIVSQKLYEWMFN